MTTEVTSPLRTIDIKHAPSPVVKFARPAIDAGWHVEIMHSKATETKKIKVSGNEKVREFEIVTVRFRRGLARGWVAWHNGRYDTGMLRLAYELKTKVGMRQMLRYINDPEVK